MWYRNTLKTNARHELKISYWLSFAICLVTSILGGKGLGLSFNYRYETNFQLSNLNIISFNSPKMVVVFICVMLFALAFSIFLANPIETGKCTFFIRAPYGERFFSNIFYAFKNGRYIRIAKTMFIRNLKIFLWSLLFIVPGIVKAYEYRMVPYIISEDPSLSSREAINLSRRMTNGEKGSMFVLDLSFLGWYLLGVLALGVGILFVEPYVEATYAQLYFILKGKVTPSNALNKP